MSGKEATMNAKRRLDLSSESSKKDTSSTSKVQNPYLKASSKSTSITNVEQKDAAVSSTVTPEAGIEKFFVSKKAAGGANKKPSAARQLVTPRDDHTRQTKKQDGITSEDDDISGKYYHSDDSSRLHNNNKKKRLYEPGHIHSSLDYHHRGDLPLDQGTLKAYRFIRNHFLIPKDIESDPKFGSYSGSCFEERVIRAYALGMLKQKDESMDKSDLLVCSYCGDEGHQRDECSQLL